MLTLSKEPRLLLLTKGTQRIPHGGDKKTHIECLCYHEFFGWCCLTYDGERGGWYMRDEHIYSEQMIEAAWVLPTFEDAMKDAVL